MPTLPDWAIQVLQVVSVLALGVKLLHKETVLPGPAGPLLRAAPYVSFAGYATVPLLIPVLTSFGLPRGYMGDILGGGLILGMASFAISIAAIEVDPRVPSSIRWEPCSWPAPACSTPPVRCFRSVTCKPTSAKRIFPVSRGVISGC